MKETHCNYTQSQLQVRHILERGAKLGQFLRDHPEIDPYDVDDMTDNQEILWQQNCADLTITQQMEIFEQQISEND